MGQIPSLIGWLLFGVVLVSLLGQSFLYVCAVFDLVRTRRRDRYRQWRRTVSSPLVPKITILIPAYDEAMSIVESVRGALALSYSNLEVVVVNDGSNDTTMDELATAFDLAPIHSVYRRVIETQPIRQLFGSPIEPRLIVADKQNGGKADVLNAAMNVASGELFCAIDADTLITPDALHRMVAPFLEDPTTVAVGGTIRLVNDAKQSFGKVDALRAPRNLLVGAQTVEYTRAFLIGRIAWNPLGGNLIISGAFGLFRLAPVREVGGYEHESIGEDMELVVRLRRSAYERGERARVAFIPDPVAYTEAPSSARFLARQRNRWFRGLLDVLTRHSTMMLNRRYGSSGMLALPYFAIVEAFAPIVEMIGLTTIGIGLLVGWMTPSVLLPLLAAYCIGMCATVFVLILDDVVFGTSTWTRDRVAMLGHVVFEQFVFHPMTVAWRLMGLWHFMRGRTEWGAQERQGFAT